MLKSLPNDLQEFLKAVLAEEFKGDFADHAKPDEDAGNGASFVLWEAEDFEQFNDEYILMREHDRVMFKNVLYEFNFVCCPDPVEEEKK